MTPFQLALRHIYWLGGSPCSGKSTVAERLAEQYGLRLHHTDENLFQHMAQADPHTQPVMAQQARSSWNEIWMKPVEQQVQEEFTFYREELGWLLDELAALPGEEPILTEGAAWLPWLLDEIGVRAENVFYMVPSKAFQVNYYSQREYIHEFLKDCEDPRTAFANWMERDYRFGQEVIARARALGMRALLVDGTRSLAENQRAVAAAFGLGAAAQTKD